MGVPTVAGSPEPEEEWDDGRLGALAATLVEIGRGAGLDAVGVAPAVPFAEAREAMAARRAAGQHAAMGFTYNHPDTATDPQQALPDARALVVGARRYRRREAPRPEGAQARVARYSWVDHYGPLKDALKAVARHLKREGWRARVLADDNALVDREAARLAGLGWYGKNANLLLPGLGSEVVLGSVVTNAPLRATAAEIADGCGSCSRCLPACPTGALVAPGVLDARRCLAWLLEAPGPFPERYRAALGDRIYGCDDCQEVCPPNRTATRQEAPPPAEHGAQPWVDLLELLAMDDRALLDRVGRWYIPGRDPRWVRRNALIALGNVGDATTPAVAATLTRYLNGADALLREHAAWAARAAGRPDLVTAP
jgi:epoxyqueuosine reductase